MGLSLVPEEKKFFELFDQQAENICRAAALFKELADDLRPGSPFIDKLREAEQEGDITNHEILDKLNRTFVTPFDREDIYRLAGEMDDIIDLLQAASNRIGFYGLSGSTPELSQLAEVIVQATRAVRNAVAGLRDLSKDRRILDYCIEINRLENVADQILGTALRGLFYEPSDPIHVIKWERIYEISETAADKCESVANTIESLVIKYG